MTQFNMQIDSEWEKKIALLQRRWGGASKAEIVRQAIDLALELPGAVKKDVAFWARYAAECKKVRRKPKGRVMSEKAFYKGLSF